MCVRVCAHVGLDDDDEMGHDSERERMGRRSSEPANGMKCAKRLSTLQTDFKLIIINPLLHQSHCMCATPQHLNEN